MTDEFKTPLQTFADYLDGPGEASYAWTRFLLLHGLGVVYLIAFLVVDFQWLPLLGEPGLLPVERFMTRQESVWSTPTLFWLSQADWFATALGWLGTLLAAVVVAGRWRETASDTSDTTTSTARRVATMALAATVATLSINPVLNLVNPNQAMNRSYTPLHLANAYGAFGGVTETRYELEIQGTADETVDEETDWQAYRFSCKPGPVDRGPCVAFPYHYRLDWQIWFAVMREQARRTWMVSLAHRLLQGHEGLEGLLEEVPFRRDGARRGAPAPESSVRGSAYGSRR